MTYILTAVDRDGNLIGLGTFATFTDASEAREAKRIEWATLGYSSVRIASR